MPQACTLAELPEMPIFRAVIPAVICVDIGPVAGKLAKTGSTDGH